MKFNKISWHLTKFHGIKLRLCPILLLFITSLFCFWWFRKSSAKFRSCLEYIKFKKFWTWQWQMIKKAILQLYRPFPGLRMPTDYDLNIPISVPIHPALAARTICVSLHQVWSRLRNRHRKPIRVDSKSIWFRLESIRDEIRKSRNITENFDSISDFIYACFQKNRCYFDIIKI